tara:strand:+ start:840 stop:1271 length:432 start_codon:yes stop_codon:yes gene_type:complete
MTENDIAYFAGLFDGEGSVYYKRMDQMKHKRPGKPVHKVWVVRMEIAMTDKDVVKWCHESFNCGSFGERKVKKGYKRQWRWRVSHRDALQVAIAIWPYSKTKLHKIEQIIDHYESYDGVDKTNVVDLENYRMTRRFNWNLHGS